jgi:hypothetical protein
LFLSGISVGICQFQRVSTGILPEAYQTKPSAMDIEYILRVCESLPSIYVVFNSVLLLKLRCVLLECAVQTNWMFWMWATRACHLTTMASASCMIQCWVRLFICLFVFFFWQLGNEEIPCFPDFVSTHIKEMVYSLLAHPQLSIRENAVKAYSLYISRCDLQVHLINELSCFLLR